jgi:hypothetical protein
MITTRAAAARASPLDWTSGTGESTFRIESLNPNDPVADPEQARPAIEVAPPFKPFGLRMRQSW